MSPAPSAGTSSAGKRVRPSKCHRRQARENAYDQVNVTDAKRGKMRTTKDMSPAPSGGKRVRPSTCHQRQARENAYDQVNVTSAMRGKTRTTKYMSPAPSAGKRVRPSTCHQRQARENARKYTTAGFGFVSHWLRKYLEFCQ